MAGILGIPPKYAHDLISCALGRKPRMPQTQGKDSPVKKCNGLNPALTPLGFVAGDGRIYHDRSKALRITRDVAKREEVIRNLQRREHARLDRLKQAAKSGDIAFTKDGVFETKPCPSCDVYHKVPYVCGVEEPCPNSYLAKYPLKKKESDKKLPPVVHVGAQTSNTSCKHLCTQPPKQAPGAAEAATQTSEKGFLPNLGPPVRRPSCIKPRAPSSDPPPPERRRRKLRFKLVPQVQEVYLSECSSCDSSSCDSNDQLEMEMEKEKEQKQEQEKDEQYLIHLENVEKEENALSENLEKSKKRYHLMKEKLRRLKIDKARQEIQDKKELDKAKHEFAEKLKRKLAIQAMLNTMNQEKDKIQLAIEKEKAARRVEEEKRKLDELLAEQLRLHMESKKDEFIKEKVDHDLAMEGSFKLPGQAENLEPVPSQLPRLSSFNVGKMMQTAKLNYSRQEAMASPAVMMEILDSLPDETESMQASGGALDDEDSKSSLVARQELKADMRQTLIILDGITRKMAEMMGHPLPDPVKPLKVASQSKVEKLPPITNQFMTTVPLEWSTEKKPSSDGDSIPKKADEVGQDGVVVAINKECTTCERDEVVSASVEATKKAATEKAAAEKVATEMVATEKATAEKAAAEKIAAKKAARKAMIQAKIAELERAMQIEMQKLKQIDEVLDTAPVESEAVKMKKQAEYEQKMAEYDQIIENAKQYRIAQVDVAMKEKQEALRIAELERAQQARMKAKLAKEEQVEREANVIWEMSAEIEAKVAKELREEMEAKLAKEKQAELEAKLAKEKQAEEEARLAKEKEAELAAKAEKQAQMAEYDHIINAAADHRIAMVEKAKQERLAAKKAEEDARMAKALQAEEAKLAKEKQAEMEAKLTKEKQAQLAEYDRIINITTDYRIMMVEKAKRQTEEARLAAMDEAKREEEIARLASMMSPKINKAEEEDKLAKEMQAGMEAKLAKEKQAEEEARLAKEKQVQMAEYDCIIKTVTDHRIAMVEKAKREKEVARLAAVDEAKRAEEIARLAGMMSPKVDKAEESEMEKQSGEVTEGDSEQDAKEVEEEIPEQKESEYNDEIELQKSYMQPTRSRPRPPTPPASHPRMHHSHTSLFGAQMSLRTINEGGGACDFTPEFASPLITHSMHAVVPYMSLRSRLGLRPTETLTDKELGEEMRRLSEATLVIKKEMMKRKLSGEQGGSGQAFEEETGTELACEESEIFSEPPEPYFTMTAGDFEQDKVSKSASVETLKSGGSNESATSLVVQAPSKERERGTLMEDFSDRSLKSQSSHGSLEDEYIQTLRQLATVLCIGPEEVEKHLTPTPEAQLPTVESEMFSEPPEPYFTMTAGDFEQDKVSKSASVETLKSGGSNESATSLVVQAPSKERERGTLMEDFSDRSLKSQSSHGSLEDEYIQTLRQLATVLCIGPEEVEKHLTPTPEAQLPTVESEMFSEPPEPYFTMTADDFEMGVAKSASVEALTIGASNAAEDAVITPKEPPIESGSNVSLVEEANNTSVRKAEEPPRIKKDSWTQTSNTSLTSYGTLRSYSTSSMASQTSTLSFTASVKNEVCDSEAASQVEQDEPEFTADGTSDDVAFAETPKSISKSLVRSRASQTSVKSAIGSIVSPKNETSPQELESQPEQSVPASGAPECVKDDETPPEANQDESVSLLETPKSSSKSSVKSRSSKTSLKSTSGSRASLKDVAACPEQKEQCETASQAESEVVSAPKSSSQSSIKSKASKTSLKSIASSTVSVKNETTTEIKSKPDVPNNEVTSTPKSPSKSSVMSKPSKTSLKSDSRSMVSVKNDTATEDKSQPAGRGVIASTQTPKKSSSKSSLKSRSSKASLKSISGSTVSIKNEAATESESQPIQAVPDDQVIDDVAQPQKSSSKSSVKSKASKTSLKSASGAQESIKNETSPEAASQSEQSDTESQTSSKDASTMTPKSSSKSSVKSKSSKTSLKSKSGSTVSVKNETVPQELESTQPQQLAANCQVPIILIESATPRSSSKSSVKSKASKTSLKSTTPDSTDSAKIESSPESEQLETEPQAANGSTETSKKSSSKSSLKSKSSKTSLKSISGSTVSVKNETTLESESQPIQAVPDAHIKDDVVQPPKSSSKSSVTSLKSISASKVSVKNETAAEVVPQPAQQDEAQMTSAGLGASLKNETPIEVTPQVTETQAATGTPKSPSISSIKFMLSKTSFKSAPGEFVRNEISPEIVPQPETKSQVISSTETPKKSSSKSSVKSKASKTSLKSISGSTASVKNGATKEPEQCEIEPQKVTKDASTSTPKSSSKSSIKSKASKTSLKSVSGAQEPIKNETNSSPEAGSQHGQPEINPETASIPGQNASSGTRKSSSKTSVRSKASKTSLKSTSSSRASLKKEASPETKSRQEKCEIEPQAANQVPKSSSKSSVKSKSSKTSLKSAPAAAQIPEISPETEQGKTESHSANGKDASTSTPKSSSKSSVKSKSSKTSLKSTPAAAQVPEISPETEQGKTESHSANGKDASTSTPKSSSKSSVKSKSNKTSLKSAPAAAQVPEISPESEQGKTESKLANGKDASTSTPKSSSKSSVKSKSSKTSLKSIFASKVSVKNETTAEVVPQPAQQNEIQVASTDSGASVKNETPTELVKVPPQVTESQVATGTHKSSSKSSIKSKSSKTSLKSVLGAPEVVPESQVSSGKDASSGIPKSSSKSSVKSNGSKTSLLSISGSKISVKSETYAEVVAKPEQKETEPQATTSSSDLKRSTPSLRLFMKAMKDISPKGSQVISPVIGKSISKQSATSPKTSTTNLETSTSRSPSTGSVKLIKSPTGSTRSLKSLRSSMKSLILPSMGSKTTAKAETDDHKSMKVEPTKSYASVLSGGSQSNITAGQ